MGELFLTFLNRSIAASWLILAVLVLRPVLKKAPKWTAVLLWGMVGLRLALPFSLASAWSLVPSAETFSAHNIQFETPAVSSGIPAVNNAVNPVLGAAFAPNPAGSVNPLYVWTFAASFIWAAGIAVLLLYAALSYARVRRSVAERLPYEGNVFLCDRVRSPFILGLLSPKIYLPSGMDAAAMQSVIAHERAHLARRDHWWKPVGFLILTVYWFNPLCWAAYALLCRDIELACDERVIRKLDLDGKKRYSAALLACSAPRRLVTVCPLAFGEVGVKERIKSVLNYKRPAFWVVAAAVAACAVVTVCFATNPVSAKNDIRLQSVYSAPPAAFFALDLAEEAQGTVIAERWENGRCVSTNPVSLNGSTQQIQLYLDPQQDGVQVQLGVDTGDMVLENFAYPEGQKPAAWSFVSLEKGEKTPLQFGKDRIIAAMTFDFGAGVSSCSCDTLSADQSRVTSAAYMIVIRTFLVNSSDPIEAGPSMTDDSRPALVMDGVAYIDPYMPVSALPYGYRSAGRLTEEQANNTGLAGTEYFTHPAGAEDLYTYQECGTPTSLDTVDSTQRQWAYVRWIPAESDAVSGRKLTLDDVLLLSQKGDALTWSDFEVYQGRDIGSGVHIMRYEIDELFEVWVGGVFEKTPMYIHLKVRNEAEDRTDMRTGDVAAFIAAHRNDVPKAAAPAPDGGSGPVPENGGPQPGDGSSLAGKGTSLSGGADLPALSDEEAAIRQAILEHNASSHPGEYDLACCSFVTLETASGTPAAGGGAHRVIYYGWELYEAYKVTDGGLQTVSGSHTPVALTFDLNESGYTLAEYWQPRDGSYYAQDIQEKFPATAAADAADGQKFLWQQKQACYAQAVAAAGLDTGKVIEALLETVCSSPAAADAPQDYIDGHPIEYRELTCYGRYTLLYCFARFEQGGETGLPGQIMMQVCGDIAAGWGEEPLVFFNLPMNAVLTGQMWYDAFKNNALQLLEQYAPAELARRWPASWLLLDMLGKI